MAFERLGGFTSNSLCILSLIKFNLDRNRRACAGLYFVVLPPATSLRIGFIATLRLGSSKAALRELFGVAAGMMAGRPLGLGISEVSTCGSGVW